MKVGKEVVIGDADVTRRVVEAKIGHMPQPTVENHRRKHVLCLLLNHSTKHCGKGTVKRPPQSPLKGFILY